jgi:ATP-dependent helicase HrpA
MEVPVGKQTVIGYPALVDDGETVSLKVFDSAEEAAETHRRGLARLFMLQFREQVKYFDKNVPGMSQMGMQFMALGTTDELKRQIVDLTFERACLTEPLPTTPEAFKAPLWRSQGAARADHAGGLPAGRYRADRMAGGDQEAAGLQGAGGGGRRHRGATEALMGKSFVVDTPFERLQHYPRYLKASSSGSTS